MTPKSINASADAPLPPPPMICKLGGVSNNYTALVYEGPTEFRTHTFEFKFFPKNSFTHLDINSEKSCEDLLNLIKKPITEKDIAEMKKSRMLIMDFYAVLPSIKRIIETGKILPF